MDSGKIALRSFGFGLSSRHNKGDPLPPTHRFPELAWWKGEVWLLTNEPQVEEPSSILTICLTLKCVRTFPSAEGRGSGRLRGAMVQVNVCRYSWEKESKFKLHNHRPSKVQVLKGN